MQRQFRARIGLLGMALAAVFLVTGSSCPPSPPADGDSGLPAADAPSLPDLYGAWYARLPEAEASIVDLLPNEQLSPNSLLGFVLQDSRSYRLHFADNGTVFVGALLDANGLPIFAQEIRPTGTLITFYPSGDSLLIEPLEATARYTYTLQGTTPPSQFTVDVAGNGTVSISSQSIHESINPAYPLGGVFKSRGAFQDSSPIERCNEIAGRVQSLVSWACDTFDRTGDIVVSETCETIGEVLDELKKTGAPEELIDRLQAGVNLACKGAAAIKLGRKFFRNVGYFGWACRILELGEDFTVFRYGTSLSQTICDRVFPPGTPPNQPPTEGCPPTACRAGESFSTATCQCECPPGSTYIEALGRCGCETADGFGFRPSDPIFGCNCPDGQINNPDTGICECPRGGTRNPATGQCECGPDAPINGAPFGDDLGCLTCEEARVECLRLINDYMIKAEIYNAQVAEWGRCVEDCAEMTMDPLLCVNFTTGPCANLYRALETNYEALLESLSPLSVLLSQMVAAGCPDLPVDLPSVEPPPG